MEKEREEEMEEATKPEEESENKRFNISCCRSYLSPKGRCYTCPELDEADDKFEDGSDHAEMQKDPDEEKW